MRIEPVVQGDPSWLALRATRLTASEAPAALGVSKYQTRAELLKQKHTGVAPEADAQTQALYARGHAAEAAARQIAEEIVGADLYPATCTETVEGLDLLASLDGLTLNGDVIFEHKLASDGLIAAVQAGQLEPHYTVQMDQQLLVTGAQACLFMASDGTRDRMAWCWYETAPAKKAALVAGWKQFMADLAKYTPPADVPAAVAAPVESLPAPSVRLDGALVVQSNLPAFGAALKAFVERIPAKPTTDQEFADTEAACKALKRAEEALEAAENSALASMADVEAMRRMVADFRELARKTRLASEKMVAARKEQIRFEEVQRGQDAIAEHVLRLNQRLGGGYMPGGTANFGGAIKGLKSLDSLRNAIDTEIARAKIEANEVADRIEANLKTIAAAGVPSLFHDRKDLVLKDPEAVAAIVAGRVAEHKAADERRLEVERERIRAEEAAKAERIARERAAAEQNARVAVSPADAPAAGDAQRMYAGNDHQPAQWSPSGHEGAAAAAGGGAAPTISAGPPVRLGALCDRFGFIMSEAFIRDTLKVPVQRDGRAVLIAASDVPRLKAALIEHIRSA